VQAIAANLLSYRLFLKLSSFLQMAAFFVILGVYFLKPPYRAGLTWVPSFWFLGLFQKLNGARLRWSGRHALRTVAVVCPLAFARLFTGLPSLQSPHRGTARYRALRPLAPRHAPGELARGQG
jgi:hypothetical protein